MWTALAAIFVVPVWWADQKGLIKAKPVPTGPSQAEIDNSRRIREQTDPYDWGCYPQF